MAMRALLTIDGAEDEIVSATRYHLEGVVSRNRLILRSARMPSLYESGVRYRLEQWRLSDGSEVQHFATCDEVFVRRFGACHNLCTWRLAELREADPTREHQYGLQIDWRLISGRILQNDRLHRALELRPGEVVSIHHVRVTHPNGAVEDCSKRLA